MNQTRPSKVFFKGTHFIVVLALCFLLAMPLLSATAADEQLDLSPAEIEYLENTPPITVVFDSYWAPFESMGENGYPIGINADILKKVAEMTGLEFEFLSGHDYAAAIDMVSKGKVDMLLSYDYNPDHASDLGIVLSEPFLVTPIAIIGAGGSILPESIFALPEIYVPHIEYVRENYPENIIMVTNSIEECYELTKNSRADFTLENLYAATSSISAKHPPLSVAAVTTLEDRFAFALRSDIDPLLVDILNRSISNITDAELNSILLENTIADSEKYKADVFFERYRSATFVVVAIVAIVVIGCLVMLIIIQKRNKKVLWEMAYVDPLTNHGNINKFKLDAKKLLAQSPDTQYSIVKLDVQRFNLVNDMYGFNEGDRVLRLIDKSIDEVLSLENELYARVDKDEFVVLTKEKSGGVEEEYRIFRKIAENKTGHHLHFSLGRYLIEAGETEIETILEKVNYAHNIARKKQDHRIVVNYDSDMRQLAIRTQEIESRLEEALQLEHFHVYLQPKYRLSDESLCGAEALVRWIDDDGKIIYPDDFIPISERNGFIMRLDIYMFEKVCGILKGWMNSDHPVVTISVNFSRLHLGNPNFVTQLADIADHYKVPKKHLEIELTESAIIDNETRLERVLDQLHDKGFTLSMDDFGTGYSALGLLKNLPLDIIKIDRQFFVNNKYKARANSVVKNVIKMARDLKITTVAEGVESYDQVTFLRDIGCDMVQGYYYSKPIPAADFKIADNLPPQPAPVDLQTISIEELGEVEMGRGDMGENMPVLVFRLFQASVRKSLNDEYGVGETVNIMRNAGKIAGRVFANELLDTNQSFHEFFTQLVNKMKELKIGDLQLEKYNVSTGAIVVTVQGDLDCSGMKNTGETLCNYDEGFIAGILFEYAKKDYSVVEVECWGTGSQICRFEGRPM